MNAVINDAPRLQRDGLRHDWQLSEVEALFDLPFMDLMYRAQQVHRRHHAANRVQMSTLLSIKTGGCPEDCGYCPQSIHYDTGVARDDMLPVDAGGGSGRARRRPRAPRGSAWVRPIVRRSKRTSNASRR